MTYAVFHKHDVRFLSQLGHIQAVPVQSHRRLQFIVIGTSRTLDITTCTLDEFFLDVRKKTILTGRRLSPDGQVGPTDGGGEAEPWPGCKALRRWGRRSSSGTERGDRTVCPLSVSVGVLRRYLQGTREHFRMFVSRDLDRVPRSGDLVGFGVAGGIGSAQGRKSTQSTQRLASFL